GPPGRPKLIGSAVATLRVEPRRQPEEREERFRVEEERQLLDPAVPHLEHLERPRLVAAAGSRLVLPEGRRAVPAHGREEPGAAAPDPGPEPPGEDVVAAAEPHVVRRHRLRRVLADPRGER